MGQAQTLKNTLISLMHQKTATKQRWRFVTANEAGEQAPVATPKMQRNPIADRRVDGYNFFQSRTTFHTTASANSHMF